MTYEELKKALEAGHREFHFQPGCAHHTGPRGGIFEHHENWRVNGNLKTWKTRPSKFRLPIKWGLRQGHYIEPYNVSDFVLPEECEDQKAAAKLREERTQKEETR